MKKQKKEYWLPRTFTKRWIKALRSGKYKQTRSTLKGKVGYCCLGVACAIKGNLEPKGGDVTRNCNNSVYKLFSPSFLEGLSSKSPSSKNYSATLEDRLVALNDSSKKSFKYIADWIEKNVKLV